MEGVRSNVSVQAQQPKKSSKVSKHLVNAGAVATGLGATGYASKKLHDVWSLAQTPRGGYTPNTVSKIRFAQKIKNGFEKLGEMIFKNPKIHAIFERYESQRGYSGTDLAKNVKFNKGSAAACLTMGLLATSILAAGIYKAGKINGEG